MQSVYSLPAPGGEPETEATAMQFWLFRKNVQSFLFYRTQKASFSFWTVHGPFFFFKEEKEKWGVHKRVSDAIANRHIVGFPKGTALAVNAAF